MKYNYFPGCSLHSTAVDYQMSVEQSCKTLGLELIDIDDWNCCGATATVSEDRNKAVLLAAITLAKSKEGMDVVAACNACYLRLHQVGSKFNKYPDLKKWVVSLLREAGLRTDIEKIKVKHLLQVILEDVGFANVQSKVVKPLKGLKVVPYYGCQIAKPESFDDPEQPTALDGLLKSLGADVLPFTRKTRCCGNSLVITNETVAFRMIYELLDEAAVLGAQAVAVACPVCQLNLDAYQAKVNRAYKKEYNIPVVYFTQLMGLAFGLEPKVLGLGKGMVSSDKLVKSIV